MSPIRVLIADDEAAARRGLRTLLARDDEVEVIGESATGEETLRALHTLEPDLVFLDIQMPGMDAFEVLAVLNPEKLPIVVFVTAYDQYTLKAFEFRAVDYLLKPFTDQRFAQTLSRAKQQCRQLEAAAFRDRLLALISDRDARAADRGPFLRRFAVGPRDDVRFVDAAKVRWIEADAYRVRVHCGPTAFTLRGNIGSFEKRLSPAEFYRISRSAIVNVAHVQRLRTLFQNHILAVLSDGTEVKVSKNRLAGLVSLLERTHP